MIRVWRARDPGSSLRSSPFLRHLHRGILLFAPGGILLGPTVVAFLHWPILAGAYEWQERQEERRALEDFGQACADYGSRTRHFIPGMP
jgi:protein-S-isoprenylcysteine O-methyltransferase Ste14